MEKGNKTNKTIITDPVFGRLPNARAGHPYRINVSGSYLPVSTAATCWFEGLEKAGLHYFPEKKQITGIPKNSGSFSMQMNIREYNDAGMELLSSHQLTLLVEKDHTIPLGELDENAPYRKPDLVSITVPVNVDKKKRPRKDMAAASRRGHLHIKEGKFREDDYEIRYDSETRWYVLAVADGAGHSKYSRKGSQIACESVVDSCIERLAAQAFGLRSLTVRYSKRKSEKTRREIVKRLHSIISSSLEKAYQDIVSEAAYTDGEPEDFATTLLLCICKKFEFGWLIGAFWVGDGAICIYHKDAWYANLMGVPDGGDCSMPKRFLTTPGIIEEAELAKRIRFTIVDDFSALFLMTNGVSDPKFDCDTDLHCFELWNKFWDEVSSEVDFTGKSKNVGEQLLKWLDFWSPGKYDDRTVAVVY